MSKFIAKLLSLLLIMTASIFGAVAQESESEIPEYRSMIVIQRATSGELAINDDDSYQLVLHGVGENVEWFVTDPFINAGYTPFQGLSDIWNGTADPLLIEDTALSLGAMSLIVTLSDPSYEQETDTVIYHALITAISADPEADPKADPIPTMFEDSILYLHLEGANRDAFEASRLGLESSTRGNCSAPKPPPPGSLHTIMCNR